ncbi:hypothetical protein BDF19DRAFT_443571 [Syncephalis fuscata]|nr:hypothetical protein BDF19DRAFT_443571 [Syncephalis fuscata]
MKTPTRHITLKFCLYCLFFFNQLNYFTSIMNSKTLLTLAVLFVVSLPSTSLAVGFPPSKDFNQWSPDPIDASANYKLYQPYFHTCLGQTKMNPYWYECFASTKEETKQITWKLEPHGDYYLLINTLLHQCIERTTDKVVVRTCDAQNDKQLWRFNYEKGYGWHEEKIISKYTNDKSGQQLDCLTSRVKNEFDQSVFVAPCTNRIGQTFVRGYQNTDGL